MSSGCGDVISLEGMKTIKLHQTFEAEVITGSAGGVSSGAEIDFATNQVTGQVQKTLPAILRDMGFDPAAFDFTTGGTVTARDTVVYNTADNNWYSWAGALPHVVAPGTDPTADSNWKPRTDQLLRQNLGSGDGFKNIGRVASVSALRGIKPEFSGQRILLDSYYSGWSATAYGKPTGVTEFVAVFGAFTDDGGMTITSWNDCAWLRDIPAEDANITHFGAIPDGVTLCDDAFIRMYRWAFGDTAQGNLDTIISIAGKHKGCVNFGEGIFAINSVDLTAYGRKRNIKIVGDVYSDYRSLNTTIVCTNPLLPAITAPALECEIAGFNVVGGLKDNAAFDGGFYKNPYANAPQRLRFRAFNIEYMGGRIFDMVDTMDTEISQIYMDRSNSTLAYAKWSGASAGTWDHTTAINLEDVSVWGNGSKPVFFLPRSHQSRMTNVWVSQCKYVGNLAQGRWSFEMLVLEGNTVGIKASNLRHYGHYEVTTGAGFDYTAGAEEIPAEWDTALGVPDYVTNPQWETGVTSWDEKGFYSRDGHMISAYTASRRFLSNPGGSMQWFNVGMVYIPSLGQSCRIKIMCCGGYNSTSPDLTNGYGLSFGNGIAYIDIQNKGDTTRLSTSWYNEGSPGVVEVRFVQLSVTRVQIYVRLNTYTPRAAVFCETNAPSRLDSGIRFYFTFDGAVVANIDSVSGILTARSKWMVGNGKDSAGALGMDFDNGHLLLGATLANITVNGAAAKGVPVRVNGVLYYLQLIPA